MADYDPIFKDDPERKESDRPEETGPEEGLHRPYDEGVEPQRALGGLYLFLIILAIVVLALALVVFLL